MKKICSLLLMASFGASSLGAAATPAPAPTGGASKPIRHRAPKTKPGELPPLLPGGKLPPPPRHVDGVDSTATH